MCFERRAFVNQKVAHRNVGVAEVGTEEFFAVEIVESASGRVTAEVSTALMSRAVKLRFAFIDVLRQSAEERRQDFVFVAFSRLIDLAPE